ncbi:MAG: AraC family transcriptional regulator [Lachnospiraceae bacterium]|nr:AraC family transcriptional regulator [Lachnospiraceae bacterium]
MEPQQEMFTATKEVVSSDRLLYTPSPFAKTNLMHLQEIGKLKAQIPHKSMRSHLTSYLCFLVLEGSGQLSYHDRNYELKQGDCVFIDCQQKYCHSTSENLWTLQWVHFFGPSLTAIYDKYVERGGQPVFHPHKFKEMADIITEIYALAHSADHIKDMRINEKLASLITVLMEESWHPENFGTEKKRLELKEIREYLDNHYTEKVSLDELAELFFINKYHMVRSFKKTFGSTINNYILVKRITHAKQMLRFSDKSLEEIGSEAGFTDAQYFCRMFKRVEGITPGEYRKRW